MVPDLGYLSTNEPFQKLDNQGLILGDIMKYLREHHLEKNTVLVFMSDNGGLAISGRLGNEEANYPAALTSGPRGSPVGAKSSRSGWSTGSSLSGRARW